MALTYSDPRAVLAPLFAAARDFNCENVRQELRRASTSDTTFHFTHPFETLPGIDAVIDSVFAPLVRAVPDLERRTTIVVCGHTDRGDQMVGTCGYYTGAFRRAWQGIPPSGQQVTMRFHEFFRLVDDRIAEMQVVWDIPELMLQARCWPMAPALRAMWQVPSPASQDGLHRAAADSEESRESARIVGEMLTEMGRHPREPAEVMRLENFWHPHLSWYGPAAIGTCRGIEGFRNGHQIPFLRALPDRRGDVGGGYYFSEGPYVAFTGWPGMQMSVTGDGWLGINPSGARITMRSLDFWRVESGLIRENWVLVDMLHVWHQLGVDVLARASEMTSQLERDENFR